ncbi:MAG: cohesin domain-containing protein [Candidatus Bathyarchaeia archaeon]
MKRIKKCLTVPFSFLPLLFCIPPTKGCTTIVKVNPELISASLDETFTINITIHNVQNLYAVDISLSWNETILELVSADVRLNINESHPDGVLYGPVYWEDKKNLNKYSLWGTSYNPAPPFYGSGNIVSLTFKVKAIGNCTLYLQSKLYDWPPPERIPRISKPIDHITLNGVFVIPEFSSIFISLLFTR